MKQEDTLYAVPLEEATADIRLYKDFMTTQFQVKESNILKAFTLHSIELLEAMGVSATDLRFEFPKVRVYIGKKDGDQDSDFKLFLVPVNEEGQDVIPKGPAGNGRILDDDEYVYDFTKPCPNTCDIESPLFQA